MKINKFVSVLLVIVLVLSTMVVGTITVNAEDSFIDGYFTYSIDSNLGKAKIVELLGLSKSTIERTIKNLKIKNIIYHDGPTKSGKWIIIK